MYRVVQSVFDGKLTTLDQAALCELAQTVMDIEYSNLDGDFLEVSLEPGTAIIIAQAKRRSRPLVQIDPGSCEKLAAEGPVAFAHIGVVRYDAMRVLLERLAPRLVSGGHLIVDGYKKEECRRAVDEYFQGKKGFELLRKSRLHVIKK